MKTQKIVIFFTAILLFAACGNGTEYENVGISMVFIPGVTNFTIGSPLSDTLRDTDEDQVKVSLSAYMMGKYEVTQKQWYTVMETTVQYQQALAGSITTDYGRGDNYPMTFVNWYETIVFCNRLSRKEGLSCVYSIGGSDNPEVWIVENGGKIPDSSTQKWDNVTMNMSARGYRLPTEAEWEYACRACTPSAPYTAWYTAGTEAGPPHLNTAAWYNNNAGGKLHNVGEKAQNNFGLHDMSGNAREWCWDWHETTYVGGQTNPVGPVTGWAPRIVRGGSFNFSAGGCRSAFRGNRLPHNRDTDIGFRVVRRW